MEIFKKRFKAEYDALALRIREQMLLQGIEKVDFFANPGNWGDAMIRKGTEEFLNEYNIAFNPITQEELKGKKKGGVLLYGGGGSWCHLNNKAQRFCQTAQDYYSRIIILPSTFESPKYLSGLNLGIIDIFCREQESQKILSREGISCAYAPDMSFFLSIKSKYMGAGTLYVFRTDLESIRLVKRYSKTNQDLSVHGKESSDLHDLFHFIDKHSHIKTDRVHIAIAGCLLGKFVTLYPGKYFKNKAIFNACISTYGKANYVRSVWHLLGKKLSQVRFLFVKLFFSRPARPTA